MALKRTGRIIINIADGIEDEDAMRYVEAVIRGGKISDEGASYCYGTVFDNGYIVAARSPDLGVTTHSFWIYRKGNPIDDAHAAKGTAGQ